MGIAVPDRCRRVLLGAQLRLLVTSAGNTCMKCSEGQREACC